MLGKKFLSKAEVFEQTPEALVGAGTGKENYQGESIAGRRVIRVEGSLLAKKAWLSSGETTYSGIVSELVEGINAGEKNYALLFDSPGGEVSKLFATVAQIQALKEEHNLSIVGIIDEMACSAAYALASVCEHLYAVENSCTASIGVVMTFVDLTKRDKANKVSYTTFRSRGHKALGSSHEGLTDEVASMIDTRLQELDKQFTMTVTTNRNIDMSVIDTLDGRDVLAKEALELGLVDEIIPYVDASFITTALAGESVKASLMTNDGENHMSDTTGSTGETTAKASTAVTKADVPADVLAEIKHEAVTAERSRVGKIVALGSELSMSESTVQRAVNSGQSFEAAKDVFSAVSAALQETSGAIAVETVSDDMPAEVAEATAAGSKVKLSLKEQIAADKENS